MFYLHHNTVMMPNSVSSASSRWHSFIQIMPKANMDPNMDCLTREWNITSITTITDKIERKGVASQMVLYFLKKNCTQRILILGQSFEENIQKYDVIS